MTFSAALDGEHEKQKDQSDGDAHQGEQPEGSDKEEDGEGGRERHSRDNDNAGDDNPERHLPDGRGLFIGRASRWVVLVHAYSPSNSGIAERGGPSDSRADAGLRRVVVVANWNASVMGLVVGVGGFEPPTSWPQTRRSSLAELHPATHSG